MSSDRRIGLAVPASPPARARRALALTVALTTLAAASAAWSLIRPLQPLFWRQVEVDPFGTAALVSAPILVGALGRIPAGMLCDRYGAGVVLPAVSLMSAGAVLAIALAGSLPAVVLAACGLGVAGTVFPVGAALVASAYPPGRRGLALSVYGAGMGGVAVPNLAWLSWSPSDRRPLLVLSSALLACAALTATLVRADRREDHRNRAMPSNVRHLLRLPATRQLAAWYGGAFGGLLALGVYLPAYLHEVYRIGWHAALLAAAGAVTVAAATRPVGGWFAGRRNPTGVLAMSYATVAALAVVLVFRLPLGATLPAVGVMSACLGVVCGMVLALIGNTAPAGRVGTIVGVVGAAGALAGMLPSLLLAVACWRTGSESVGWALLAGLPLASAMYLRGRHGWIGGALAFDAPPAGPVTTVVSLAAADARRNSAGVFATLGALNAGGDLVIVYGYRDAQPAGMGPYALVAGLRDRLPRQTIVTAYVHPFFWPVGQSLVAEMLDDGDIVVICTPATDLDAIAARLADHLGAAHLLRLTDESIGGLRLSLPWPTDPVPTAP